MEVFFNFDHFWTTFQAFLVMNAIKQNHLFYAQEREYEERRATLRTQNQARFQEQLLQCLKDLN